MKPIGIDTISINVYYHFAVSVVCRSVFNNCFTFIPARFCTLRLVIEIDFRCSHSYSRRTICEQYEFKSQKNRPPELKIKRTKGRR